jgi:hypothetical protein
MSTTDSSSAIDDKKTDETVNVEPDFKAFVFNYIYSIIFTIGVGIFIIGGLGLYTAKVAQSNILPANMDYAPYSDLIGDNISDAIPIAMNIMRPNFFSPPDKTTSQTAIFLSEEYLDSFVNSFICLLKTWADPSGGFLSSYALYFSKVYDNIVAKNFLFINFVFGSLGQYLPESIIMLVYAFFGPIIWIVLFLFSNGLSILYHTVKLGELFRGKSNTDNNVVWSNFDLFSMTGFFQFMFFIFLGFAICLISTFVMPIIFTLYALIAPLSAKYKLIDTTDNDKTVLENQGVMNFIMSTFVYKKFFFFLLASLSLILNGNNYLGSSYLVGILIAIVILYFIGFYKNPIPIHEDDVTFRPSKAAKSPKTKNYCPPIPEEEQVKVEDKYSWTNKIKNKSEKVASQKGGKKIISKSIVTNSIPTTLSNKYKIRLV